MPSGTAVTDEATLSAADAGAGPGPGGNVPVAQVMAKLVATGATGPNLPDASGTVTYTVYSLNPHQWGWNNHSWGSGWHWNKVASGGIVTVTVASFLPRARSRSIPGSMPGQAKYSGDDNNAPS